MRPVNKRTLGVAAVFLVGCAVGGVSSQLVVPKASAQQAATLPKWQMHCVDVSAMGVDGYVVNTINAGKELGERYWEPVGGLNGMWCFKRQKL